MVVKRLILIRSTNNVHYDHLDDLPPPPPEAYGNDEDEEKVQSKSFQMLRSAVDSGGIKMCITI